MDTLLFYNSIDLRRVNCVFDTSDLEESLADDTAAEADSAYSEEEITTELYIPLKTVQVQNHSAKGYEQFAIAADLGLDAEAFMEQVEYFFGTDRDILWLLSGQQGGENESGGSTAI